MPSPNVNTIDPCKYVWYSLLSWVDVCISISHTVFTIYTRLRCSFVDHLSEVAIDIGWNVDLYLLDRSSLRWTYWCEFFDGLVWCDTECKVYSHINYTTNINLISWDQTNTIWMMLSFFCMLQKEKKDFFYFFSLWVFLVCRIPDRIV